MKRKLFAMLLATALIAAQGLTAFAAGSAEAGGSSSVITDGSGNPVVKAITDGAKISPLDGSKLDLGKIASSISDRLGKELSGAKVIPSAYFEVAPGSPKTITFWVTTIPDNVNVYALHLNSTNGWEEISCTRNGDYLTVTSANGWSPLAFVYTVKGSSGGSSGSGSSSSGGSTPVGLVTSPKTGASSDWSLWMGGAVALLAISSVMFRKREA